MPPPTKHPRRPRPALAASLPLLLLPVLLQLGGLAGCGGSDETTSTPDAEQAAAAGTVNPFAIPSDTRGLRIANPRDPERAYNFDLGRVPYGSVQRIDIELENVEDQPVTIRAVKPGCGCTVPSVQYTDEDGKVTLGDTRRNGDILTVPPGRHADLTLEIDTRNVDKKNQSKRVLVRITSEVPDSTEVFYLTLEVHLIVDLPFASIPGRLDMKRVPTSGGGVALVEITRTNYDGLSLGEIVHAPDNVLCDLRNEQRFGHDVWTLSARLIPPIERGLFQDKVVLQVLDESGEVTDRTFEVPIQALVIPDVDVVPSRLVVPRRPLARNPTATSELATLLPGHRLRVVSAHLEGTAAEHLRLTVEPAADDGTGGSTRWILKLAPLASLDVPQFEGEAVLELDDPQFPEIRVPYSGAVVLD